MRRSSSAALGPVVSQPDRSVSATAAISSSPIAGGWKPSMVARRVSDESFDIGLESDCGFRAGGALERLLTALPYCQDCSRPVWPAAELLEAVAGAPVDADATDTRLRKGLLDAGDLAQFAGWWDEEADARTADTRHGRKVGGVNFLPERRRECSPVQVDSQRDTAELGVV